MRLDGGQGEWVYGAVVDGVPFGDEGYVRGEHARRKREDTNDVMEVLGQALMCEGRDSRMERQVCWTLPPTAAAATAAAACGVQ